jgi:chromate transporter
MSELFDLFIGFGRAGLFGFGGGPSMIPLIQVEVVEVYRWLTPTEFLDAFAFGNALPGPIATKLAGYVGYQVAGIAGAMVALLGITAPTIVAMVALAGFYLRYRESALMINFLRGVRPVVIALLMLVVWDFAPSALGHPERWLANWPLVTLALAAFIATLRYKVHPALLIVIGGLLGILFLRGWQV